MTDRSAATVGGRAQACTYRARSGRVAVKFAFAWEALSRSHDGKRLRADRLAIYQIPVAPYADSPHVVSLAYVAARLLASPPAVRRARWRREMRPTAQRCTRKVRSGRQLSCQDCHGFAGSSACPVSRCKRSAIRAPSTAPSPPTAAAWARIRTWPVGAAKRRCRTSWSRPHRHHRRRMRCRP